MDSGLAVPLLSCSLLCASFKRRQQSSISNCIFFFVDFTKAFDTNDRTTLRKILEISGCPDKLVNITKLFHYEMKAQVTVGSEPSDAFISQSWHEAGVRAS